MKGGTDPAGALERLGAMKKSFDRTRNENPDTKTILIVSCVTSEMNRRLRSDPLIDTVFNLTEIINDMDYREKCIAEIGESISHRQER